MSLEEKKREAKSFYEEMKKRYPHVRWEVEHFMLDLVEEIGELANAILCERGHKFKNRQKSSVEDALFDVLFDLFMVAEAIGVNLEKAWNEGLSEMYEKLYSGFFDPAPER
jgi:NTP pyrophosphatase (non-canonical NTP hydrolase)